MIVMDNVVRSSLGLFEDGWVSTPVLPTELELVIPDLSG